MSQHWKPPESSRFGTRQIATILVGAVAVGLVAGVLPVAWAPAPVADSEEWRKAEAPDPWAESRRSQAMLRGQEGGPSEAAGAPAAGVTFMASSAATGDEPAALRVVDGDTFWYGGEKIRIADIDTPEVNGRCAYETQLAARATARMAALLRQGPFQLQSIDRDEDRYGRKLRVVTRNGRSLGDQLVAEGLARTWSGRREPWCV